MGEDAFAPVEPPPPSAASSLRLLGLLKQPDSDSDHFPTPHLELDESDVVWSSASDDLSSSSSSSSPSPAAFDHRVSAGRFSTPYPDLIRSPLPASSCSPSGVLLRPFSSESRGLSAALEDDRFPLVLHRRPSARSARPLMVPVGRAEDASVVGRTGCHQSAPVNVPAWPRWRKGGQADVLGGLEEEEGWDDDKADKEEEIVPPHVIVARSQVTTFSVFEGVGRIFKGRDLRRVRNAVLRKTGFLDS